MTSPVRALTPELSVLMEHEKTIEQGLATFVDVGLALAQIRDGALYQAKGFDTFEAYCAKRWGFSRSYAYRLLDSAAVVETVSPIGDMPAPTNEAQARELAPLAKASPAKARKLHVVELGPQARRIPAWSIDQLLGRGPVASGVEAVA